MSVCSDLSNLIEGGISHDGVYIIRGVPGTGKTVFSMTVLKERLQEGARCAWVHTDGTGVKVKEWLLKNNVKKELVEDIVFLGFDSGTDLTMFSHNVGSVIDALPEKSFLVFDSISSLLLGNDAIAVAKFVQVQVARCRQKQLTMIMTLDLGLTEERATELVSYFVDSIFEVKSEEDKRFFRVLLSKFGACDLKWHEFKISNRGFEFFEFLKK